VSAEYTANAQGEKEMPALKRPDGQKTFASLIL
jgi:hypothetical protein